MQIETTDKVPVERLRLDRKNPRLIGEFDMDSEEAIISSLYRGYELDELLQSISANGYMDIEPLIVTSDIDQEDGELIVLEGNRRLAAVRLLREPDLVERISKLHGLRIKVPNISDSNRATLDEVSVYPVACREDARSFIGFKHINGPAKWDAYAKARFAADWYKSGRGLGINLSTIASAIGDRHDTIKRMVSAIYVLDQARAERLFKIEDRYTKKLNFSHLYTALARSQYMDYLGLGAAWASHDPEPNQVARENLDKLRNVLVWIYGSRTDDLPPVVQTQNPDIKRLGEVLVHPEGHHMLEADRDLDVAHASIERVDTKLTASLIRARTSIRDAAGSLRAYDGRDQALLDIADDIKETAEAVYEHMSKKRQEAVSKE